VDVPLYALLVGIADYPHPSLSRLYGPRHDVEDLRAALVDDLGAPAEHVVTLVDEQATRAGIEAAFASHLHAHGDAWRAAGAEGPPPAFLFYFSGHGSQARDETGVELDGLDETLVPHDGRETSVYDVKDHELGRWLARLPGDNVTVVLDCCHSGSGSRDTRLPPAPAPPSDDDEREEDPDDAVRSAPPDLRPQPATRPSSLGPTRGVSVEGSGHHVLLAACRDHEEAFEYRGPDGTVRGALSTFLVPALLAAVDRPGTTYRELHQMVRFDVNRARPLQSPLCEGDLDREVFSSRRVTPEPGAVGHVIGLRDGEVWCDAGVVHGITPGSRLRAADTTISVRRLEPTRCAGPPVEGAGERLPARGTGVRLARLDLGAGRWRVLADQATADVLATAADEGPLAGLVTVTDDETAADLRVRRWRDGGEVRDAAGRRLVRHGSAAGLVACLGHLTRVAHLRRLERDQVAPGVAGGVELTIHGALADPLSGEVDLHELPVDDDGATHVTVGERLVLEVANTAEVPLHLGIVVLSDDWRVTVLHPAVRGAEDRFAAGVRYHLGTAHEAFFATLPAGRSSTTDLLRAIVTTHPTSFEALELDRPDGTWRRAADLPAPPGGTPPVIGPEVASGDADAPDGWATASVRLTTRRRGGHPTGWAPT
jgi:hypothetical protein